GPQVPVQQLRLAIRDMEIPRGELRVDVPRRNEKVLPPIVVSVEEPDAEAHVLAVDTKACPDTRIAEAIAGIAIERRDLFREIRPDDIEPAIAVVVADADAHARQRNAAFVECASRRHGNLAVRAIVIV